MEGIVALVLAASTAAWSAWKDRKQSQENEKNRESVQALEVGKLDLEAAKFGHQILLDLIQSLRDEVRACHEERDGFHAILVAHGLLLDGQE